MNEKTLRALVDAGALKRIRIIGDGALFHVEADMPNGSVPALTTEGHPKNLAVAGCCSQVGPLSGYGYRLHRASQMAAGSKRFEALEMDSEGIIRESEKRLRAMYRAIAQGVPSTELE